MSQKQTTFCMLGRKWFAKLYEGILVLPKAKNAADSAKVMVHNGLLISEYFQR